MKIITFAIFLFLALPSYSQHNLYTFNEDKYVDFATMKGYFDKSKKTLPDSFELKPFIYHKIIKEDTVINYVQFSVEKKTVINNSVAFKLDYQQDSLFLLLGKKLPAFKLKDMNGKEVSGEDLRGKPSLINFWATWCGPCVAEMPQLSRLKEHYKDKVNFISITENDATVDHLADFLKDKDFNFQVLDRGEDYKHLLKIGAIPKNLFIDKNGVLRYIQQNYPMISMTKSLAINDKDNYFTTIIERLIKESL
jgi:thiol-disulfide isomerase/thioredoxin